MPSTLTASLRKLRLDRAALRCMCSNDLRSYLARICRGILDDDDDSFCDIHQNQYDVQGWIKAGEASMKVIRGYAEEWPASVEEGEQLLGALIDAARMIDAICLSIETEELADHVRTNSLSHQQVDTR